VGEEPADIGSRWEPFVDEWLIETKRGVALRLHEPVKREVVLTLDAPWEDALGGYYTAILEDDGTFRLYYRGACPEDRSDRQVSCLAVSPDGIHFERPKLGLFEHDGSKENNIVWRGDEAHNLAPFIDTNPDATPEARYKAVGGSWEKLYGLCSLDGIHWKKMRDEPLEITGQFDSHNVAFWDVLAGCYRSFSRYFDEDGCRAIQSATSGDFIHWTKPEPNRYPPGTPREHLYTNATVPCPGAEHILLAFPKRFVPERKKVERHPQPGLSDTIFMSSRDGVHWDRSFLEAWVRPGLDERNWTERSNLTAWGILQTASDEFSMYISEHYRWPDSRIRRMTIRRHGFASVNAPYAGGEFTTRPVIFSGRRLVLNYSTSAVGSVRVEIQRASGEPVEGRALEDMEPLYGDELDAVVAWRGGDDLAALAGRPVRFRFVMKDADIFAVRVAP